MSGNRTWGVNEWHSGHGVNVGDTNDFDLPSLNEPVTNTKLIIGRNGSASTTPITAIHSENQGIVFFYLFRRLKH